MAETTLTSESKRNSSVAAILRVCLAGLGLGIVLAYGLSSGSFTFPKWFFCFLAALSAAGIGIWHLIRNRVVSIDEIDILAASIFTYGAISLAWTPDAGTGLVALLRALFALAVFVSLRRVSFEALELTLPFVCVAGTAVVLVRIGFGEAPYGGFGNESFAAEFLMLALPYVGMWWVLRDRAERWIGPILVFITLAYLLGFKEYTFSKIIFIGGPALAACAAFIFFRHRLTVRKFMFGGGALALAVLAFIAFGFQRYGTITSLQTRIELTYNTLLMWLDRPVFGHGLGSFDYVYPLFMHRYLDVFPAIEFSTISEMLNFAGAAHNEPAQLLAELGVTGLLLVALFVLKVISFGGPLTTRSSLGYAALTQLVTTLAVVGLTFVLQNPATLLLVTCSLAVLTHRKDSTKTTRPKTWSLRLRWLSAVPLCAFLVLLCFTGTNLTVREFVSHRYYAEAQKNFIKKPADAFEYNRLAVEAFPANPNARRQLWVSFVQWIESGQKNIPYALDTHDDIYAVSASTGPHAPGLLIPRIYYFILTNQVSDHAGEIEEIFDDLKRRAGRLPDIYVTEALYALKLRDSVRAARAIADADARIPGQDPDLQQFQRAKTGALKRELQKLQQSSP